MNFDDTIVALASGNGRAAVSIIRLSGINALDILKRVFAPNNKNNKITPRYMHYGQIELNSYTEKCMAVFFNAPNSYTGENSAEIFSHGNPAIVSDIISLCIKCGCRAAENGEFTRRALINNKLDLAMAEGVGQLINAESSAALRAASKNAFGVFSAQVNEMRAALLNTAALIEVGFDYSDDYTDNETIAKAIANLKPLVKNLNEIIKNYNTARLIYDGVKVVIVGEPNSGKSTLLNALVGFSRAIVTDIAGTTRDVIESSYIYNAIKFNVSDTAGLRDAIDPIEKLGILRTYDAIASADVVVCLDDFVPKNAAPVIYVANKIDIKQNSNQHKTSISALKNINIDLLKKQIYDAVIKASAIDLNALSARQYSAVVLALDSLQSAINNYNTHSYDCLATDIRSAHKFLGDVLGVNATEDVLAEIFSKFCVGK